MPVAAWVVLEIVRAFAWESHAGRGEYVFKTRDEMTRVWQQDGGKPDRMPKVDFEQELVLAVFAGQKQGTGHRIKIEAVAKPEKGKDGIVLYRETAPKGENRAAQVTYPNHVVVIKKVDAEFKFIDIETADGQKIVQALEQAAKK